MYYLDEDDEEKEKIEMEMDRKTAGIKGAQQNMDTRTNNLETFTKDASSCSFL